MCGIVGYIGIEQAAPIILDGLAKLEYRGYDSAGICVFAENRFCVEKTKGRLSALSELTEAGTTLPGTMGIGHTRWATHGEPSDINSHPHGNKRVSVVHNGIIENYRKIKEFLISKGYTFDSETDTETVAKLLDYNYSGSPVDTIISTIGEIEGAYALGIIFRDFKDKIFT